MSTWLIVFLVVLFIVTVIGTIFALGQQENDTKSSEKEGSLPGQALKASDKQKPDTPNSVKSVVKSQGIIYGVTIVVAVIIVIWFVV